MEILRSLQIERVNLSIASQKTAGDQRRKCDALSAAGEQGIVARIKDDLPEELAFNERSLLRLNELTGAAGHIKNVDILQRISQGAVRVNVDWFAQLEHEPVIALVVQGAQVIRFVVKRLAAERKTPIEEIRLGNCKNKVFSLGAVLET